MSATRPMSESFAQVVATSPPKALNAAAPSFQPSAERPVSEILPASAAVPTVVPAARSAEADAIDRWVDDLAQYEETIDAMARASLDQNFKDELSAIEQWFQVLSDAERTATLYSLLQHTSRVQQGFFIAFLQQILRKEARGSAKKAAEVGRARRMSQNKPQLAGIAGTNEKYARMYGEDLASQAAAVKSSGPYVNRPRSAATPGGGFPDPRALAAAAAAASSTNAAANQIMAAVAAARPRSVVDPSAYEDVHHGVRAPPGLDGPPRGAKWSPLTPTFSNFSEIARGIERPQSTNDLDRTIGAYGSQSGISATRGPSKLGGQSHTAASILAAAASSPASGGGITSSTVRSPMGPGDAANFAARTARASALGSGNTAKLGQTPPLSASVRGLASPAFPPGLFPSNPWAAAAAAASPGFNSSLMHGLGSARSVNGPAAAASGSSTPSQQTLKQKFASLIVENRIDTAKEVTARLSGLPVTPTSAASINAAATVNDKSPKPVDPIDFRQLNDIPAWFRGMRLHKYTPLFESMRWQDIIKLTDEELSAKGVSALGARRKMLKVFDQIKAEAPAKGISLE